MSYISIPERNKLFLKIKHLLGYPLRPIDKMVTDDTLTTFLEMAIEDYSSIVNEWLLHQQWINLEGMDKNNGDFLSAFTTKSNKYMESFTYAYSRQVGLGTNAPSAHGWELKRDFITTETNTQHYIIPAGREVNEVLWETPPEIDMGLIDPFAMNAWSAGAFGWNFYGRPAMYVQPVYSTLLSAQDRRMKQRVLQSTLTYRITGLETGEKVLHLYPVPGSRNEIASTWGKHYAGKKVWYFYYDTMGDRDKCLEENDDTVKLPSDPPLKVINWDKTNVIAQQQIRDLFLANTKIALGGVMGFYSGELGVSEKQLTLDYRHLLDEGEKLKELTTTRLKEQLEKLSQVNLTEERAKIAQNVNTERGFQPPQFPIIPI